MNRIDAYARAVVQGDVPAGKYHRLSCERHLRDRAREGTPNFPFRFDVATAERFFRFAEQLRHYKGQWATQRIVLQDWQKFLVGSVFGWVHTGTGLRRFRTAYNEIPRKNGKTTIAATVALYATFFDGEPGNEGYIVATKREQSKICFTDAKQMVQSSGLRHRLQVQVGNIHQDDSACKLEPLGADHDSTDGLNPGFVCVDEMHAMKDRGMLDVMETATGARRQPLVFQITTAGDDPVSPCGDQHDYACKILDDIIADETFFCFVAQADPEDDWTSIETARKANPNYGVSVKPDDMLALMQKATHMPSAAAAYQQKRLGRWVNASAPWLSLDGWRRGQSHVPFEAFLAELEHESCYAGLDLASKLDLCALVLLFPPTAGRPTWRVLRWVWTPADTLLERARKDRAPYDVWVAQGHLLTTPGNTIDQNVVAETLVSLRDRFDIEATGFDPWHADKLIDDLKTQHGFTDDQLVKVPQTYAGMGSAARDFEADVLDGLVDANGCPLMAWCASNAVVQRDGKDNIYPVKKKSRGRIDPIMASIIARRLVVATPSVQENVYLQRGVRTLGE